MVTSTVSNSILQGESKWSTLIKSLITKHVFGDKHHAEVNIVLIISKSKNACKCDIGDGNSKRMFASRYLFVYSWRVGKAL